MIYILFCLQCGKMRNHKYNIRNKRIECIKCKDNLKGGKHEL